MHRFLTRSLYSMLAGGALALALTAGAAIQTALPPETGISTKPTSPPAKKCSVTTKTGTDVQCGW